MDPTDLPRQRLDSQFKDYFPTVAEILANDEAVMSALTEQVQELNENSVETIQDTVHSVMTSSPSQQTVVTTAPLQNKPVNDQHLYHVRIDGIPESKSNKRAEIDQHEEKELNEVLNFLEETPPIESLRSLGKTSPDDNARPHTLLVTQVQLGRSQNII